MKLLTSYILIFLLKNPHITEKLIKSCELAKRQRKTEMAENSVLSLRHTERSNFVSEISRDASQSLVDLS